MDDEIYCPLVDCDIAAIECIENRDVCEQSIPQKYKIKPNWKEICQACPYYDY